MLADDVLINATSAEAQIAAAPLTRAIGPARRAAYGLSVLIDARLGRSQSTGTLVQVAGLVGALTRSARAEIRVVVDEHAREALAGSPGIALLDEKDALGAGADLVHRPLQVFRDWELATLPHMAQRVVLTNLDLIGYRNRSYFAGPESWREFRQLTRRALTLADHVVFPSSHARADALADDLVSPERAVVVPLGLDHGPPAAPARPAGLPDLADAEELIVCLGADYRHKNRVFALRVLGALQRDHAWPGRLVFAGPHMTAGSSAVTEAEMLAADSRLAQRTLDLGTVTEPEKEWLYRHAALVLYPTTYEGFGLVPFEAAAREVPCLWANTTSLIDLLGDGAGEIVMWDAEATAARALELMRDRAVAQRSIAAVQAAGNPLTWEACADRLLEIYGRVCDGPGAPAATLARAAPEQSLTEDGLRLVGANGALPHDLERPLLALATHPRIGRPVLGAINAGYRLSQRFASRRRADPRDQRGAP